MKEQETKTFFYETELGEMMNVHTFKGSSTFGGTDDWFLAKDVCEILEIGNVSKACSRLEEDEKLVSQLVISGQKRDVLWVNESGLYSLILTSRKPEAKRFKKWITSEVLPALRLKGNYTINNKKLENDNVLVPVEEVKKVAKRSGRGIPQGVIKLAERMADKAGLDDNQTVLALNKLGIEFTGVDILEAMGISVEIERRISPCGTTHEIVQDVVEFRSPYPRRWNTFTRPVDEDE